MEKKGIGEISNQIAEVEAYDETVVKSFMQNLVTQIKDELEDGNDVNLDGLGTLSTQEKGGEKFSNLQFEEEYKQEVNGAFDLFEPVELTAATIKESTQELEHKTIEQINEEAIEEAKPLEIHFHDEPTSEDSEEVLFLQGEIDSEGVTIQDEISPIEETFVSKDALVLEEDTDSDELSSVEKTPLSEEGVALAEEGVIGEIPLKEETTDSEEVSTLEDEAVQEIAPSMDEVSLGQASLDSESEEVVQEVEDAPSAAKIGNYQSLSDDDGEATLNLRRRKKRVQMNWISIAVFIFIISVLAYFAPEYISDVKSRDEDGAQYAVDQSPSTVVTTVELLPDTEDVEEIQDVEEQTEDLIIAEVKKHKVAKVEKPAVVSNKEVKMLPRPNSVVLKSGERLALLARRYYGSMFFWVYIYDYNKMVYPNPDLIPSGAKLLLPDPSEYAMDKDDPDSIERAKAMIEALKK